MCLFWYFLCVCVCVRGFLLSFSICVFVSFVLSLYICVHMCVQFLCPCVAYVNMHVFQWHYLCVSVFLFYCCVSVSERERERERGGSDLVLLAFNPEQPVLCYLKTNEGHYHQTFFTPLSVNTHNIYIYIYRERERPRERKRERLRERETKTETKTETETESKKTIKFFL